MTRFLVIALFFVIWLDSVLGVSLSVVPGLSAKNIVLYLAVMWIVLQAALDGSHGGVLGRRHDYPGLHLAFVALILLAAVSAIICLTLVHYPGYSPGFAIMSLKTSAVDHYLVLFVFLAGLRNAEEALQIARVVLVAMGIGGLIWALELLVGVDLGIAEQKFDGRVRTPMGDAAQTGAIMTFYLPVMIAMGTLSRGVGRASWYGFAAVGFAVLLATTSRGALAGLVGAAMLTAWLMRGRIKAAHVLYSLAGGLLLAVLAYLALDAGYRELLLERVVGVSSERSAFDQTSGRTMIWGRGLADMAAKPVSLLIGHGWKSWDILYPIVSHNEYLATLFNLGVLGLLLQLYIYFYPVRQVRRAIAVADPRYTGVLIGFLLGYLSIMISIFFVNMYEPWLLVWSFAGIMLRLMADSRVE